MVKIYGEIRNGVFLCNVDPEDKVILSPRVKVRPNIELFIVYIELFGIKPSVELAAEIKLFNRSDDENNGNNST